MLNDVSAPAPLLFYFQMEFVRNFAVFPGFMRIIEQISYGKFELLQGESITDDLGDYREDT